MIAKFQSTPDLVNRENAVGAGGVTTVVLFQSTPDLVNRENLTVSYLPLDFGCFNPLPI